MLVKGNQDLPKHKGGILVIQLGDIGDVVLTMPTIRTLRENFSENNLIVCVREVAKELIEDCPWVNGVISVNKQKRNIKETIICQKNFIDTLRKYHFNIVIDLRTGTRGAILAFLSGATCRIGRFSDDGLLWRNRLFTHLVRPVNELSQYSAEHNLNIISPFNLSIENSLPILNVSSKTKESAHTILTQENVPIDKPIIVIHPFSLWKYKDWRTDGFISLIDHITAKYHFSIIITGSPEERLRAKEMVAKCKTKVFNLVGKTSIGELPGVFQSCRLFIGVDTAALHIAAAVGIPTVGIFGPSAPINWAPRGNQHCVVSKSISCVPCMQKGCQDSEFSLCLEELTFEEVNKKVDEQISRIVI